MKWAAVDGLILEPSCVDGERRRSQSNDLRNGLDSLESESNDLECYKLLLLLGGLRLRLLIVSLSFDFNNYEITAA